MDSTYNFKLYIVDSTLQKEKILHNLEVYFKKSNLKCTIEVIDVLEHPEQAVEDGVCATPTLIKISPLPKKKIIGFVNNENKVLAELGIESKKGKHIT